MLGLGKTDTTDQFFTLQVYKDVLAKNSVPSSEAMAVNLQNQLMSTWWDKVLRLKDANKMRALMSCMFVGLHLLAFIIYIYIIYIYI